MQSDAFTSAWIIGSAGRGGEPVLRRWAPLPLLSGLAVAVPLACMAIRYRDPGLWLALQRDAATLSAGPWWRLISPLAINSAGWGQWAMVSLGFVLVGAPLERRWGRRRWLGLALAGAVAGEVAAYWWAPEGGGASNALCGLLGGMAALAWAARTPTPLPGALYALALGASVLGLRLGSMMAAGPVGGSLLSTALSGACLGGYLTLRRRRPPERQGSLLLGSMLLLAILLTLARDEHGPALLAGAALAGLRSSKRPPAPA